MNEITLTIIASAATITLVTLILVVLLLWVKTKLTPSGTVKIDINGGNKVLEVAPGNSLMGALAEEKIFLPSSVSAFLKYPARHFATAFRSPYLSGR